MRVFPVRATSSNAARCINCCFYEVQRCKRHAPVRGESGDASWPELPFARYMWCGEWVPDPFWLAQGQAAQIEDKALPEASS